MADTGSPPSLQSPSEPVARARQQRVDAAMTIASAFRGMTGALRTLLAQAVRWEQQRNPRRSDALQRSRTRRHRHRVGADPAGREGIQSRWAPGEGQRIPTLVDRRTRPLRCDARGQTRATANLPRARCVRRSRTRRDRAAARRHPCRCARAPGPSSGGLIIGRRPPAQAATGEFRVWSWNCKKHNGGHCGAHAWSDAPDLRA